MDQILLPKQIDFSKITYGNVKLLASGGKIVPIYHNGKPLIIQTSEMSAPFGLSKYSMDNSNADVKYNIDGSFKDLDLNKSLRTFFDKFVEFDKLNIQAGLDNSLEWFRKKLTNLEVVEALYTHMIKYPKDKETGEITDKYPPTFSFKLNTKDGKITTKIYNKNREEIDILAIPSKGSKITGILRCSGIWLAGGKFGCSWRVEQLRVDTPNVISGFAFQDEDYICDSDEEDEGIDEHMPEEVQEEVVAPKDNIEPQEKQIVIEDSDNEDDIDKPKTITTKSRSSRKTKA